MQVTASVTRADPAWAGLAAAQQIAREYVAAPRDGNPLRADVPLTTVRLDMPASGASDVQSRATISIQYLRN